MPTPRVFGSGNSQAVRLPKEFRLSVDEVEIFRRGEEIVLREKPRGMERVLELLDQMPDDAFEGVRDERPPPDREGL